MNGEKLYICATCFQTSATQTECHAHGLMMECEPGEPGNALRRPVKNNFGEYWNTAPRWFLEAVGWSKAGPTVD